MALASDKDSQINKIFERTVVVETQEPFDLSKWENELTGKYDNNDYKGLVDCIHKFIECIITNVSNKDYPQQILISRKCFSLLKDIVKDNWRCVFVNNITKLIFDIIIEKDAEYWCAKKQLLKIFNNWIEETKKVNRREAVKHLSKIYLLKMVDSMSSYGDYDLQVTIIETIFRMYGRKELCSKLKELTLESETISQTFAEINLERFDEDCRTFLNYFNKKNKKIFSIVCESVLIEGIACDPPMEDLGGLWVDFNICNKAVSWYFKAKNLDNSEQVEQWELITLFASDLENTSIKRKMDAVTISFHFKLSGHLISSFEENEQFLNQATNVVIILKRNEETEKLLTDVLPKMLDKPQEKCSTAKNIKVSQLAHKSLISQPSSEVSSTYPLNPTSNQPITSETRSASSNEDRPTNLDAISSTKDPNNNISNEGNDFSNQISKNIQILSGRCHGSSFSYRQINSIKSLSTPEQNTRNSMKVSKNQETNSSSVKWKTAEEGTSENIPNLNKGQSKTDQTEDRDSLKANIPQYNSSEKENINKASIIKYDDVKLDYLSLKVTTGNKKSEDSQEIEEKLRSFDHSMDFPEEISSSNHAIHVSEEKTTSINQEAATKKTDSPENIPKEEFDKEVYNEILENDIIKVLNKVGAEYETSKHHKHIGSLEQDKTTENVDKENHDPQTQTTKKYSEPYISQEKSNIKIKSRNSNTDVNFDILTDLQNTKIENARISKNLVPKRTDKINTILTEKVKQNLIQSLYEASTWSNTPKDVKKSRKREASNKEFDDESVRPIKSIKIENNLVLNKELVIVLNRIEESQKVGELNNKQFGEKENQIRDQNGSIIGEIYNQNHPEINTEVEEMVKKPSITSNQGPSTEKRKKHRNLYNPIQITVIGRDEVDTKWDTSIVTKKTLRSSKAIERTSKLLEVISEKGIEKVFVDEITSAVEDEIRVVPENFSEFEESLARKNDSVKNSTKNKRDINEKGNKKTMKENVKSKLLTSEKMLVDEITSAIEDEIRVVPENFSDFKESLAGNSDSVKNSTKNKNINEKGNKKSLKENVKSKRSEVINKKTTEKILVDEITSAIEDEIRVVPENFSEFKESLTGKNDSVKNSTKNKSYIKEKGNKKSKTCSFQTNITKHTNLGRNTKNVTSTEEKHRKYIKLNATKCDNYSKSGPKTSFEQTLDSYREMFAQGKSLVEYINNRKDKNKSRKRISNRNRTVSAETEKKKEKSASKKPAVRRKRISKKKFALDVSDIEPRKLEKCSPVSNTPILEETNTVKQIAIGKDAFKKNPQPNQIVEENVSFGNQSLLETTTKKRTGETNLKVNKDKIVIISDIRLGPLPKRAKIQEDIEDEFTTQKNNIEEPEVNEPEKRHANLPYDAECLMLQSAPSWTGTALLNDTIVTIKSSDFIGKYLVLFFYPYDFACMPYAEPPSEILSFNENYEEFLQLNTEIVGCSVDFCCTHRAWLNNNLVMQNESTRLKFPLLADIDHKISQAFMIYSEKLWHSYRGFYIIDPEGIIIAIDLIDLRFPIFIDEIFLRIRGHTSRQFSV